MTKQDKKKLYKSEADKYDKMEVGFIRYHEAE